MKIILPFPDFFSKLSARKRVTQIAILCSIALGLPVAGAQAQISIAEKKSDDQSLLSKKISIEIKNETLQNALNKIAAKVKGVSFSYDAKSISAISKVNLSAINKPVWAILDELLKPYGFSFTVVGKNIIINRKVNLSSVSPMSGRSMPVAGRVVDESGKPIVGASILVRGGMAAITNENGEFAYYGKRKTIGF